MMKKLMYLCNTAGESVLPLLEVAKEAIAGGIDVLQLRHKGIYDDHHLVLARQLGHLCRSASVIFVVNDRPEIAVKVDADAVHLGQNDASIAVTRKLLGDQRIIGATASTLGQAIKAEEDGADYVCLGHIYHTTCMPKPYPPIGTEVLLQAKERLSIPVWAIGGINSTNAADVIATGITGIAVVSAIQMALDASSAARKLKEVINGW